MEDSMPSRTQCTFVRATAGAWVVNLMNEDKIGKQTDWNTLEKGLKPLIFPASDIVCGSDSPTRTPSSHRCRLPSNTTSATKQSCQRPREANIDIDHSRREYWWGLQAYIRCKCLNMRKANKLMITIRASWQITVFPSALFLPQSNARWQKYSKLVL